jgi:hypothetical protein
VFPQGTELKSGKHIPTPSKFKTSPKMCLAFAYTAMLASLTIQCGARALPILTERVIVFAEIVQWNPEGESDRRGYHALFEVFIFSHIDPQLKYPDKAGFPHTKEYIILELEKQVKLTCSGVIKPVKDLQTETGVNDVYTQFWIDGHIL